jgi:N,N-dimethylformamidase beta subunit-like protein
MIRAYPHQSSIFPGETLILHVSTDSPKFRVSFYRQGKALTLMQDSGWLVGQDVSLGAADTDWGWPGYAFPIPSEWSTGVYIAMFREGDVNGVEISRPDVTTADGRDAKALFVIKNAHPGKSGCILYKVPLFTYQAYNEVIPDDHGSLYTGAIKVTLRRPGGGTGGTPWDFAPYPDVYDATSPRQTFAHWDAPFISWLESNGYAVDYCTDLDVHLNANNFLASYHLLLSVGHDEYWSTELRANIKNFVQHGGNVAFFSGNTCWWRVHVEDNATAIRCEKSPRQGDPLPFDQWYRTDSENTLTGVSFRGGGGDWAGTRQPAGYTVELPDHWVYQGTSLQRGDVLGADERLVGYEADGALITVGSNGFKQPTGTDGTPLNFAILGTYEIPSEWPGYIAGDQATMGIYTNKGIVFTAATTDWTRVLASGKETNVDRITRNVLDRLKSRGVRIIGPLPTRCNRFIAVVGTKAKFQVDVSGLPNQGLLKYQWTITDATGTAVNVSTQQASFEAVMSSAPVPTTVSVVVDDGTICKAFGTITFTPLSAVEAVQAETFCELGHIGSIVGGFKIAVSGVREGNRFFVDPLWDPIRNATHAPLNGYELNNLFQSAMQLTGLLEQLIKIEREKRD